MVSNQLRPAGVHDVAVLAAMNAVPRERFVGAPQGALCYRDTTVPLSAVRAMNPPIATGKLLDAARVRRGDRALVVGASTGYVAALLAALGASVVAVESDETLTRRAHVALDGVAGVELVGGSLVDGWAAGAPYDVIVVDGGAERIPDALVAQLADGGRLVAGLIERGVSRLVAGRKVAGGFGLADFADVETAALPGFAPEPAFTF